MTTGTKVPLDFIPGVDLRKIRFGGLKNKLSRASDFEVPTLLPHVAYLVCFPLSLYEVWGYVGKYVGYGVFIYVLFVIGKIVFSFLGEEITQLGSGGFSSGIGRFFKHLFGTTKKELSRFLNLLRMFFQAGRTKDHVVFKRSWTTYPIFVFFEGLFWGINKGRENVLYLVIPIGILVASIMFGDPTHARLEGLWGHMTESVAKAFTYLKQRI